MRWFVDLWRKQGCLGKVILGFVLCSLVTCALAAITGGPKDKETAQATVTVARTAISAPSPTSAPRMTPVQTATLAPTASPTVTSTNTPMPRTVGVVQVVEIVDGDTIRVRIGGEIYAVRYIGIDCPEKDEPLYEEATAANRQLVEGQEVRLEKDVSETDKYGRLLRYVWLGDVLVNAELVRQGLAEAVRYPPDVKYQALLQDAEAEARRAQRGLWRPKATRAPTGPVVQIASLREASEPEEVTIRNVGDAPQDMTGWYLVSVRGHQVYRFPAGFVLQPGESVTIYSGPGAGQAGGLFWTEEYVWNNREPDPAELYNAKGELVSVK